MISWLVILLYFHDSMCFDRKTDPNVTSLVFYWFHPSFIDFCLVGNKEIFHTNLSQSGVLDDIFGLTAVQLVIFLSSPKAHRPSLI